MIMKLEYKCQYCGKQLSDLRHLKEHEEKTCKLNPNYTQKVYTDLFCEFCKQEFKRPCAKATHERICLKNPNRKPLVNNGNGWKYANMHKSKTWKCKWCKEEQIFKTRNLLKQHLKEFHPNQSKPGGWNKGLTAETNEKVAQIRDSFRKSIENGTYKPVGRKHTEAEKKHLSECAKKNCLGGWHTSKTIEYKCIKLDSKYEFEVAKELDDNQVKWERPTYFLWEDTDGVKHRYYPDFYLPEYNVYLDPKNDYLINNKSKRFGITDVEKIEKVKQQNGIRIIILDKENLTWKRIKEFIAG